MPSTTYGTGRNSNAWHAQVIELWKYFSFDRINLRRKGDHPDLEKRLDMRLCQRGRAGFALTDQGREVLRAVEAVLAAIEGFRSEVNQLHQSLRGDLNIGLMNNLVTQPRMRITHALKTIRQQNPGVRVKISMSTPGEIERGLLDGRLHVGAMLSSPRCPGSTMTHCTKSARCCTVAAVTRRMPRRKMSSSLTYGASRPLSHL